MRNRGSAARFAWSKAPRLSPPVTSTSPHESWLSAEGVSLTQRGPKADARDPLQRILLRHEIRRYSAAPCCTDRGDAPNSTATGAVGQGQFRVSAKQIRLSLNRERHQVRICSCACCASRYLSTNPGPMVSVQWSIAGLGLSPAAPSQEEQLLSKFIWRTSRLFHREVVYVVSLSEMRDDPPFIVVGCRLPCNGFLTCRAPIVHLGTPVEHDIRIISRSSTFYTTRSRIRVEVNVFALQQQSVSERASFRGCASQRSAFSTHLPWEVPVHVCSPGLPFQHHARTSNRGLDRTTRMPRVPIQVLMLLYFRGFQKRQPQRPALRLTSAPNKSASQHRHFEGQARQMAGPSV